MTHVGAVLQEVGRAAVAQRVGGHPHRDPGGPGVAADEVLDALDRKPGAAVRQEERPLAGVVDELGARVPEVDIEGGHGPAHDGDDAVLPSLAEPDEELAAEKIHVPEIEPLALADADRGPVEKLEDGTVAFSPHCEGVRARDEPPRLGLIQEGARKLLPRGEDEVQRGVLEDDALSKEETEEPLHEGEVAPLRGERVGVALRALRLGKDPCPGDGVLFADGAEIPDPLLP